MFKNPHDLSIDMITKQTPKKKTII